MRGHFISTFPLHFNSVKSVRSNAMASEFREDFAFSQTFVKGSTKSSNLHSGKFPIFGAQQSAFRFRTIATLLGERKTEEQPIFCLTFDVGLIS